jgi:hypothetical protein
MKTTKLYIGSFLTGVICFFLLGAASPTGKKISEYPNTATLSNTDLFIVASGNTNKNISWLQLSNQIMQSIPQTWLPNGTNISYSNGNVGIGTTNPVSPLHVKASGVYPLKLEDSTASGKPGFDVYYTGYPTTSGYSLYYDTVNAYVNLDSKYAATAGNPYGDINFRTKIGGGALATALTISAYTGNVGIGTTSPTTNLCVAGEIQASSLYVSNTISADAYVTFSVAPESPERAAEMVKSFRSVNGKVDHANIDPGLWGKKVASYSTNGFRTNVVAEVKDAKGKVITPATNIVTPILSANMVPDNKTINLGMQISALNEDANLKDARIAKLEEQVADLLKRVEALEKR